MATQDPTAGADPGNPTDTLDAISLEADRALTLLDMARAALNECATVPDIWTYFEQTMRAHLERIEKLAGDRP